MKTHRFLTVFVLTACVLSLLPVAGWAADNEIIAQEIGATGRPKATVKIMHRATSDPTVNDDITLFVVGTRWINTATGAIFDLVDATDGAAVWAEPVLVGGDAGTPSAIDLTNAVNTPEDTSKADAVDLTDHEADDANPHAVTAAQAGAVPMHDAAVDPTANDDVTTYTEGTIWRNNQGTTDGDDDTFWILADDTDTAATWNPMLVADSTGAIAVATLSVTNAGSLRMRSLAVADLGDTATPSVLTIDETIGTVISNYQATGADHVFTLPAAHAAGNVIFYVGDEFQVDIEPPSGANFVLNGTAMAADKHIQNTSDVLHTRIVGYVVNVNGTLTWIFNSADAEWVEEAPSP